MKRVVIIGSGLSGAVVARQLANSGWYVEIYEKRNHIGGNMYDYVDKYGILVHKYGPHTFHSNSKKLVEYVKSFCEWDDYQLLCGAVIDGLCTPTPFNFKTIDTFYSKDDANKLKEQFKVEFGTRETITVVEALQAKSDLIRAYAEFLFRKDYGPYTAKQWGVEPSEIDSSILKRVPLRLSYKEGYFDDKYQIMPRHSYSDFFEKLLNHPNIKVNLQVNALTYLTVDNVHSSLKWKGEEVSCPIVYTGEIDALFEYSLGHLPYRSLHFEWKHKSINDFQEYAVVAYPQAKGYTRIVEFKKMPLQKVDGTSYEIEFPLEYKPNSGLEPYYPVLTDASQRLYSKYAKKVEKIKHLYCCGRLAEFKYYNMDQALAQALDLSQHILSKY